MAEFEVFRVYQHFSTIYSGKPNIFIDLKKISYNYIVRQINKYTKWSDGVYFLRNGSTVFFRFIIKDRKLDNIYAFSPITNKEYPMSIIMRDPEVINQFNLVEYNPEEFLQEETKLRMN